MRTWIVAVVLLVPVLASLPSIGMAAPLAESFDARRAWLADSVLSSPAFGGRRSGSSGGVAAEEWIAARFAEANLRPAAEDGSFLQGFPVIGYEPAKASLELLDGPFGKVPFVEGVDWTLLLTPGAGKVTSEAVLVGYGIDSPAKKRNDYEGVDVRGKIAVILRGHPDDGRNWDEEYKRTHTFAAARAHGAAAVLYWQEGRAIAGAALAPEAYDPKTPSGYISNRVLDLLLRETGWTTEAVRAKLATAPFPLPTGKRLRIAVEVRGNPIATAHNVIGMIRGDDPLLGSEIVLIGAHLDHIGVDASRHIFPGANDNASGAAMILEMARAAQQAGWTPRRTIVFVGFGGEEMGLLGSKYFAAHMPFDSSRCVAMMNLDMVGQGDGGTGVAGGSRLGPPYFAWRAGLDSVRAAGLQEESLSGESSDYSPFADRGIPALGCWSRGHHGHYHDIEDRPGGIQVEVLKSVGKTLASLLESIVDYPESLRDGLGHERALRAGALQVALTPLDAATLSDPVRTALDGDGRIAGRLVACDLGRATTDDVLRRLGALSDLPKKHPWIRAATRMEQVGEGREELDCSLMPMVSTGLLDRLGPDGARSLCATGLAGAVWSGTAPPPGSQVLEILAQERRILLIDPACPWRGTLRDRESPHSILRWNRGSGAIPNPPDSTVHARLLLVLSVEGIADSSAIRQAVQSWGEMGVHIDIASGLETGVDDRESLRFIAWLRRQGWGATKIGALLGGNLRGF
jgi:aminopeptidase YwaD